MPMRADSKDWVDQVLGWLPFLGSALAVSLGIQISIHRPWLGFSALVFAAFVGVPRWLMRRRLSKLFRSADMTAIMAALDVLLRHVRAPETFVPLAKATALSAYGRLNEAQHMLDLVHRGNAWDAASEQRLVLEVLQDTFQGKRQRALKKSQELLALPLPTSPWARHHARLLREGMAALARAFARVSEQGDIRRLRRAADDEPLLSWAVRYAEAIIELEQGNHRRAGQLLALAPEWPEESVFSQFQLELERRANGDPESE